MLRIRNILRASMFSDWSKPDNGIYVNFRKYTSVGATDGDDNDDDYNDEDDFDDNDDNGVNDDDVDDDDDDTECSVMCGWQPISDNHQKRHIFSFHNITMMIMMSIIIHHVVQNEIMRTYI